MKKRTDGRYQVYVEVGKDPISKKRIRKVVYGKTIKEVNAKVDDLKFKMASGVKLTKQIYFSEYKEKWFSLKRINIRHNTMTMYEGALKKLSPLNEYKIHDITRMDIQNIINDNLKHPRTCQKIKVTINQIMESAIIDGLIMINPCKGLVLPKYKSKPRRPLTENEDYLTEVTEFSDREKMFIIVMKYFGLRPEEARGLKVSDFDLNNNIVSIKRSLTFKNYKPIIEDLKTDRGKRKLPILSNTYHFIKYYLTKIKSGFLFRCARNDDLITGQSYRRMWESILSKLNKKAMELNKPSIEGLTPYIFRHNYATMIFYAGVPLQEAMRLMGHSSVKLITEVYAHLDHNRSDSQNKLDEYLGSQMAVIKN